MRKGAIVTRRNFLQTGVIAAAALVDANAFWGERFRGFFEKSYRDYQKELLLYNRELPIPALAKYRYEEEYKVFDMHIQESLHPFFEGELTRTYGINSSYLGETIVMKKGDKIKINYSNHLKEPTTMHGHGMHVPAKMDGGVHQVIAPFATWSAVYEVKQEAATNWYHPHLMGETARQVYQGLAGVIIIEDEQNLPKEYGVDDIPLIIQERRFINNQIDYSPSRMELMRGYRGGEMVVNGAIAPKFQATTRFLRLRLLNGSNASIFKLGFLNQKSFYLIGGDNSLLPNVSRLSSILLSPAERAEIVVDLQGLEGSSLYLFDKLSGKEVMKIEVASTLKKNIFDPNHLIWLEEVPEPVKRRKFVFGMRRMRFTINGKSMDRNRIDEYIKLNEPEEWIVENPMRMAHNFHMHATHFRVIERNGSSANVRAWERGYKDTVFLAPGDRVKLRVVMRDFASATDPYMYHCHFLEHEDNGMMGQFVVI